MRLGLAFQATVKPAGDHLWAICWNGICILGLDYLVVSFCIESTLWVVSNKPLLVQRVSALIISKQACNDCTAWCLQEKASFPYFNSGYAEAWMNPHRRSGKRPDLGAILRAVKLSFLSSLGIGAIVNNYHLGLTN